jgi:hypothetical protein
MTRRILISMLVLLVVVCVGLSMILIPGALLVASESLGFRENAVQPTPTRTPVVLPTSTPGSNLPPDVEQQMDQIQVEVMQIRGLTLSEPLIRGVLTPEQLQERVMNEFFSDYTEEEAAQDALVYYAWGLLEADFDLIGFFIELYSEQVAGYYDTRTKEMYVVQGEGFFGNERLTYAHEFTHVLQDQTFDLREGMRLNEDDCEENSEYCAAVTALVEGDAVMTQMIWFWRYATDEDRSQVLQSYETYESPVFDTAPGFIQEDLMFPYVHGREFVESLFDRDGWDAVDAAYADPPVSTEQILHPDRYPDDQPVPVDLPELAAILGDGWVELYTDTLGEWYTYLILTQSIDPNAQVSTQVGRQAAAGWGGDSYAVYLFEDTQQLLLLHRWLWDTSTDADEFWVAFEEYGRGRWGSPDSSSAQRLVWEETANGWVTAMRSGDEVLWLAAPNERMAGQILEQMPEFQEEHGN